MTLIVELPPEVETQVLEAAKHQGSDISTYFYETVVPRLRPNISVTSSEADLLLKVREDFPQSFWNRFALLSAKRDADALTPQEWQELASATESVEAYDAKRLFYLTELARRRNLPIRSVMKDLGLRSGINREL